MLIQLLGAIHAAEDARLPLRIFFSVCLFAVIAAGIYVFRKRRELFGRDPQVGNDTWAARNLRLWQVLLVWILAMELIITMLFRV